VPLLGVLPEVDRATTSRAAARVASGLLDGLAAMSDACGANHRHSRALLAGPNAVRVGQ
jgi:hypothetical protein